MFLQYPRGVPAAECRVARPPVGDLFSHLGPCGHHGTGLIWCHTGFPWSPKSTKKHHNPVRIHVMICHHPMTYRGQEPVRNFLFIRNCIITAGLLYRLQNRATSRKVNSDICRSRKMTVTSKTLPTAGVWGVFKISAKTPRLLGFLRTRVAR